MPDGRHGHGHPDVPIIFPVIKALGFNRSRSASSS
jgi:hypothetical protein